MDVELKAAIDVVKNFALFCNPQGECDKEFETYRQLAIVAKNKLIEIGFLDESGNIPEKEYANPDFIDAEAYLFDRY